MHLKELETMNLEDLHRIAKDKNLKGTAGMKKKDLIFLILKNEAEAEGLLFSEGVLEIMPDGYGFLRRVNYLPHEDDIYISASQIGRFACIGDLVTGKVRPPKEERALFRPPARRSGK